MAKRTSSKAIDGDGVLYHYLQKDLLKSDIWLFQMLSARLVVSLGVWIHPDVYRRYPILRPYAVREPDARGNRARGLPDRWGTPNPEAFFSDDNSLVKDVPKPLRIETSANAHYAGRRIGTGFVASHVSRQRPDGRLAARDARTYSFVPNLVWLPRQVAQLTDREGSFTQAYIQAISRNIYESIELPPRLAAIVRPIWDLLPEPVGIPPEGLPSRQQLNFFRPDAAFFARRMSSLAVVLSAIEAVEAGREPPKAVLSQRFREGLPHVDRATLQSFGSFLRCYRKAVDEAAELSGRSD